MADKIFTDRRSLELKYQIPMGKIDKFFEALEQGKVLATKCKICGKTYFPPQGDCPECRKSEMDWVEVQNDGTLLTFTVINAKPTSFSKYPDYVVGIAKFGEINVLSWVNVDDYRKLKIGMKVHLKVVKREDYFTYQIEL